MWDWYHQISDMMRRVRDEGVEPIAPTEWLAWLTITGNLVRPAEMQILISMDQAYCSELGKELKSYYDRKTEEAGNQGK